MGGDKTSVEKEGYDRKGEVDDDRGGGEDRKGMWGRGEGWHENLVPNIDAKGTMSLIERKYNE